VCEFCWIEGVLFEGASVCGREVYVRRAIEIIDFFGVLRRVVSDKYTLAR